MLGAVAIAFLRRLPPVAPAFLLLLTAPLKMTKAEVLYEMYAATPYQTGGDVYCSTYAADSYDYPTWAEYFGGGCEGRQCKFSGGDMLVHHFRCRPGIASQSRRCRSPEEDSSFPHCCLPACSDALY
ncbi:uncharacterized protein LOC142582049 [Dermacentor variabilis]|uniref:uncharacterized protein LOC142582049 n=1 Tax=Dermacentor variabilis TaxID=34621 RepID=UPI003F5C1E02